MNKFDGVLFVRLMALCYALLPTDATAQCTGVFVAGAICGNPTGTSGPPRATTAVPGTSSTFIQSGSHAIQETVQAKARERISFQDYGAVADNTTSTNTAINNAFIDNAFRQLEGMPGRYKLASSLTIPSGNVVNFPWGASFERNGHTVTINGRLCSYGHDEVHGSGFGNYVCTDPVYGNYWMVSDDYTTDWARFALYGIAANGAIANHSRSAIVGISVANSGNSFVEPVGVMATGILLNKGGVMFGLAAQAYNANYDGTSAVNGVITNEINTFNYKADPPGVYPPDRGFDDSRTMPVVLTVASGGNFKSEVGIQLVKEGSHPQQMNTGIYMNPDAIATYGLFIDAAIAKGSRGSTYGAFIRNFGDGTNLLLATTGSMQPGNQVIQALDAGGTARFNVTQNGDIFSSHGTLNLGQASFGTGKIELTGTTSGAVAIRSQDAAGTYNFNLPTTAGSSGNILTSGGGGSSPMTWLSLGSGVSTFLTTPSSANLAAALTDETGSGKAVFDTNPTFSNCVNFTTASSICASGGINTMTLFNNRLNDAPLVQMGGTSASFPAIKRDGPAIKIRLADDSGYAPIAASAYSAGATAGVSCSGAPTASFATVNGIVTHC